MVFLTTALYPNGFNKKLEDFKNSKIAKTNPPPTITPIDFPDLSITVFYFKEVYGGIFIKERTRKLMTVYSDPQITVIYFWISIPDYKVGPGNKVRPDIAKDIKDLLNFLDIKDRNAEAEIIAKGNQCLISGLDNHDLLSYADWDVLCRFNNQRPGLSFEFRCKL
jgi:hypothetical protein